MGVDNLNPLCYNKRVAKGYTLIEREDFKMMTQKEILMYDTIVDYNIATPEEINLVRNLVSGSWGEILNQIVQVRTGYNTIDQYLEEEFAGEEE